MVTDRQTKTRDKIAARAKVEGESATALEQQVNDLAAQIKQLPATDTKLPALQAQLTAAQGELTNASSAAASDTTDSKTADGGLENYEEAIKPADPAFPKPMSWALIGGFRDPAHLHRRRVRP